MFRSLITLSALAVLLSGCTIFSYSSPPPEIEVEDVSFQWGEAPTLHGYAVNRGGYGRYVALSVVVRHPDNPKTKYAIGTTYLYSLRTDDRVEITVPLYGSQPPGEFTLDWYVTVHRDHTFLNPW